MRVYVASSYSDYPRARAAMTALRAAGHDITHDWTALADQFPNDDAPLHLRAQHAREDLQGVRDADVVLLLTPSDRGRGCGCWIETGAALALGKPVIITGPQRARSIFCELAAIQVEEDAAGIAAISEQPTMRCPRCRRMFFDFDGFGVLWCDRATGGCGYCRHAARSDDKCDFCGRTA